MDTKEIERWYRLRFIKKAAQFFVLLAIVALIALYSATLIWKNEPRQTQKPVDDKSGISMENFTYSSSGAHPFELIAESAKISDTLDRVELKGMRVVYQTATKEKILLTANSGDLNRKTGTVLASGNVVIRIKGFVIETETIEYSNANRIVRTPARVSLKGKDLHLTGKGLKLSVDGQKVRVEEDVVTKLYNVKWVEPGRKLLM